MRPPSLDSEPRSRVLPSLLSSCPQIHFSALTPQEGSLEKRGFPSRFQNQMYCQQSVCPQCACPLGPLCSLTRTHLAQWALGRPNFLSRVSFLRPCIALGQELASLPYPLLWSRPPSMRSRPPSMPSRFKVLLVSTSAVAESGAQPQAGARQKPQQEEVMSLHARWL